MIDPHKQKEKSVQEWKEDEDLQFCWGLRKGAITLYESFTLDDIEYSLYDCVYMWRDGQAEPDIGKLVKIWETESHEKKVEVVWFFRPIEIANWLGDIKPLQREIFLASGHGKGLSNLAPLEAISGKCNVVCSSKHNRNPQPTEEEFRMADYIFYRTFDVGKCRILEKFPSSIAGIQVDHFFNMRKDAKASVFAEPKAHSKFRIEEKRVRAMKNDDPAKLEKVAYRYSVPDIPTSRQINNSKVMYSEPSLYVGASDVSQLKKRKLLAEGPRDAARPYPSSRDFGHEKNLKEPFLYAGASDVSQLKKMKLLAEGPRDAARPHPPSRDFGHEKNLKEPFLYAGASDVSQLKKMKLLAEGPRDTARPCSPSRGHEKNMKDLHTRVSLDEKARKFPEKEVGNKLHMIPAFNYKFMEVTRKPGMDSSKWFKLEVWNEERLHEMNEKGTLVLLENLDPTFTSAEVEDIIWRAFEQKVKAKMVQQTALSNPHFGQAFAIFKTKEAADHVLSQLTNGCLVLGDGRPIVGRRRLLSKVGTSGVFAGYLSIDRTRPWRQREEIKNAVATSHFSQPNTIEYQLALQWRVLQEKSELWWTALREEQGKKTEALMKQMKIRDLK